MIYTKLNFLNQPSNLQTLVFTLSFDIPLIQVYTAVFVTGIPLAGQIKIGINLAETISNTKNYLETNYPTPVVDFTISGNEILITPTSSEFSLSSFTNIASVLTISEEITIMKKIFIRSPYFIEVDEVGQTSAKIEVFFWNKGTTEPTTPNYTFTKQVPSPTQTKLSWNISNLAEAFIKPIAPVSVSVPTEENVNTWCYMKVKRYSDNTLLNTETFVCLNGYTSYLGGYNQSSTDEIVILTNVDIKRNISSSIPTYINVWFDASIKYYYWLDGVDIISIDDDNYLYKIPINNTGVNVLIEAGADFVDGDEYTEVFRINTEIICEPIYTPIVCKFINRFGGWEFLTFFKANQQGIDVKSKDYNLLPSSIDYNPLQGIKQRFNFQGTQKIKCNTGWVDENYSELIQDLMLSQVVLLDNKPAVVKSQSFDIKTHLKDKNINYEVEFEYNYGLINDVI